MNTRIEIKSLRRNSLISVTRLVPFCILVFLTFFFGCSDVSDSEVLQSEKVYPDQESWNSEIVLTKDGRKRAIIVAGHLEKYNDRAEITLDGKVDVDFFDIEETHLSHLNSDSAKVYEKTNDMIAQGNVVVVSDSGVTLYTEELKWDSKREKIVSDVFVKLVTDKDTLTGIGFESDSNLENWVIYNPSGVTDREVEK
jgi:LPS export ABC transporter protein LptC